MQRLDDTRLFWLHQGRRQYYICDLFCFIRLTFLKKKLYSLKVTKSYRFQPTISLEMPVPSRGFITVFTVFRLLTDFVCLYNYEFWLSLCKIVRSSVILLLPLFTRFNLETLIFGIGMSCVLNSCPTIRRIHFLVGGSSRSGESR
jgi:hypothetical protein